MSKDREEAWEVRRRELLERIEADNEHGRQLMDRHDRGHPRPQYAAVSRPHMKRYGRK